MTCLASFLDQMPTLTNTKAIYRRRKRSAQPDFIIINGAGYDAWAENLIGSGVKAGCTILNVADLVGVKQGDNPHLWYLLK